MSVYKLELEKASIIIKKETIINPPPVIETVDIPDGVTFGYSDFSDIENLKMVLPYVNNGIYPSRLFASAIFPKDINGVEFKIYNGTRAFINLNNNTTGKSGSIVINCERVDEDNNMQWILYGCYLDTITFKNTGHIKRFANITGTVNNIYIPSKIYGLDVSNCIDLTLYTNYQSSYCEIYIDNFGKHPDFTSFDYQITNNPTNCIVYSIVDNSFDRAAAGYEPCIVKTYKSSKLTEEQIAKATSKGYTITS